VPYSLWKKSGVIRAGGYLLYAVLAGVLVLLQYTRFLGLLFFIEQSTFALFMIYFMGVDLRQWRVPVFPALIAIAFGISFSFLHIGATLIERSLGALGGVLFLWSVLVVTTYYSRYLGLIKSNEFSLGSGDFLIVSIIGSFVGYLQMPLVLALGCSQAVALFVLGKIFPSLALLSPWSEMKSSYPLGAFLCLAALEILIISH